MGEIIGDSACPQCCENGGDKTKNHLILFEDGGAYCNRCSYKTNWKEKDLPVTKKKDITDEELKEVLDEFNSCEFKEYPERKLSKATVMRYGCRVGYASDSRDAFHSYLMPYHNSSGTLTGYKVRLVKEKKFWNAGRVKDAVLFGQQLLPKGSYKKLYIAESAMDAMSIYQALREAWKLAGIDAQPNVVGLPHGTSCAVDVLSKNSDVLDRAEEIILVMDNDKAGKEAVDKICALYPKAKTVTITDYKDPNEMLVAGKGKELAKLCQFHAVDNKLDGMADIGDLLDEICTPPTHGVSYPWKSMTDLTFGLKPQQIIGIAGGVGLGKSDIKNELVVHICKEHKQHCTVFDLEYGVGNTGRLLASKMASKPLNKPGCGVVGEDIHKALEPLTGLVSLYKHKGARDWDEIKNYVRHSVIVNNSKFVFLDPITALVAHLSSNEANDMLNTIFSDMSALIQELDFTFMYFAHLNPPKTGATHERGGKVHEAQMTGSRAMMKWSTHIWGLEGNKDPDIPEYERNVRKLVLLKDREYGNVGNVFLHYDPATSRYYERIV